jgi:hypothetical protein
MNILFEHGVKVDTILKDLVKVQFKMSFPLYIDD